MSVRSTKSPNFMGLFACKQSLCYTVTMYISILILLNAEPTKILTKAEKYAQQISPLKYKNYADNSQQTACSLPAPA